MRFFSKIKMVGSEDFDISEGERERDEERR